MKLLLRDVKQRDWDFILELRNSFYSFFVQQNAPIFKNDHYKYLKKQSKNQNFYHWIIMSGIDKVGYVRILDSDVGIMVKKEFQNKGIASKALKLLETEARGLGIKKLIAHVLTKNKSSKEIFLKNNYKLTSYILEKNLQ